MPAKEITHEVKGMKAVFREKLGSDVLDAPIVHHVIAEYIRRQTKSVDATKIPKHYWGRIIFVTNVMQQTVSLDGLYRFDIPSIDAPDDDITDFYEFMMSRPEHVIDFFQTGLRKFDSLPLAVGGNEGEKSPDVPNPASLVKAS